MILLSSVGIIVLVAIVVVGAYWLVKNVSFKRNEKEDSND
jgi:heme/copper-type cytochrome/quinol oxidase subunit 4